MAHSNINVKNKALTCKKLLAKNSHSLLIHLSNNTLFLFYYFFGINILFFLFFVFSYFIYLSNNIGPMLEFNTFVYDADILLSASENKENVIRPIYGTTFPLSRLRTNPDSCMLVYLKYLTKYQFELGLGNDQLLQDQLKNTFFQDFPNCKGKTAVPNFYIIMDNFVEVLNSDYSLVDRDRELVVMSFMNKVISSGGSFESIEDFWNKFIDFLPNHRKAEFNQFKNDFIKKGRELWTFNNLG